MSSGVDASEVDKGLDNLGDRFLAALGMYCETAAQTLETKAKTNRPWTDRSSRARQSLKGSSEIEEGRIGSITLAQGVDYGLWLELAHEKQYAIVEPTIRLDSNEVVEGLRNLVDNLEV